MLAFSETRISETVQIHSFVEIDLCSNVSSIVDILLLLTDCARLKSTGGFVDMSSCVRLLGGCEPLFISIAIISRSQWCMCSHSIAKILIASQRQVTRSLRGKTYRFSSMGHKFDSRLEYFQLISSGLHVCSQFSHSSFAEKGHFSSQA